MLDDATPTGGGADRRSRVAISAGVTNRSWQGLHLINTRGCGLVLAPTGRVQESQRPDYRTVDLERPELYFSPTLSGYAIANSESSERECERAAPYDGHSNGVRDELIRPARRLRARLPRLQRARLRRDQRRLADVVGPWHQRPAREAGTIPVVRHRPVPGLARRPGGVGRRRLHHVHPLPVRRSASATCSASSRPAWATTTTTSATASRPSSTPTRVR